MTKVHRYSFFGKTILIIQSPSIEEAFIFLTCIRKKQDGQWEKPSHGEGKTVKCNIEEMAMILQVMKFTIKFWETYHDYKGQKPGFLLNGKIKNMKNGSEFKLENTRKC